MDGRTSVRGRVLPFLSGLREALTGRRPRRRTFEGLPVLSSPTTSFTWRADEGEMTARARCHPCRRCLQRAAVSLRLNLFKTYSRMSTI